MSNSWHHIDERRENWLLLRVGPSEESESNRLTFWELAVGNADAIIRKTASDLSTTSDDDVSLLDELLSTLGQYRRVGGGDTPLLITPDRETLRRLRAALLARQDALEVTVSLRGFGHVAIRQHLQERFGQRLDGVQGISQAEAELSPRPPETRHGELRPSSRLTELWELWTRMFALLPAEAIRGTPL